LQQACENSPYFLSNEFKFATDSQLRLHARIATVPPSFRTQDLFKRLFLANPNDVTPARSAVAGDAFVTLPDGSEAKVLFGKIVHHCMVMPQFYARFFLKGELFKDASRPEQEVLATVLLFITERMIPNGESVQSCLDYAGSVEPGNVDHTMFCSAANVQENADQDI
jgi:hypothetical protein